MTARIERITREERVSLLAHLQAKLDALQHLMCVKITGVENLLCAKLAEAEHKLDIRLAAVDERTILSASTLEKRMEGMNEFRGQLKDQSGTFITRVEWTSYKERLDADIRDLREDRALAAGKASQQSVNVASLIAVGSLLLGVIGIVIRFV